MALLNLALPREGLPQQIARPDQRWIDRGLKSAYLLRPGIWQINLVTGNIGGTTVGTGVTFVGGKLRTPGTSSNGALLEHGLATNVALPITLVAGWKRVSGSTSWSLLRLDAATWTGWYGNNTGEVITTSSNSFDGALTSTGAESVAFTHVSATELRGFGARVGRASDATAVVPGSVNATTVCLGYSRKSSDDNPGVADFTHFYAFQGALTDGELFELANFPEALFEAEHIWVPVSAGIETIQLMGQICL